jgi:EAL domain-containing protein (putative c-di-GMP-specific phosphodiesterase class I)/ActR/RegA family two-component response regulator
MSSTDSKMDTQQHGAPGAGEQPDGRPRKILVVDDEPFVLKVLVRQLTQLGYETVLSYESAREALAMLERDADAIDVVFTDLQMPEMDGIEFLRQLVERGYDGRIVLVSGEDRRILKSAEKLARSRGLQVLGSLAKPATREQLRERLVDDRRDEPAYLTDLLPDSLPDSLRAALAAGAIHPCFQPQVSFATGRVTGFEVLPGWRRADSSLDTADRFLSAAQQYAILNDFTRATLPGVLEQAARWHRFGDDFRLGLNLSMDDLASLDFPDFVADAAAHAGFPLSRLVLEVTETRITRERLLSLDVLTRLRLKRISLLIDDFGTGHASLEHLRDIPFDELKLHTSFVRGAGREASVTAIVEASLALARQLSMRTIAHGIDDLDDWRTLRAMSCEVAQGEFVGAALAADALPAWHDAWQRRYSALAD